MATYTGKTIVVTGASSGIGRALCLGLAAQRPRLVLSGRDEARLEQAAEACRARGAEALAVRADVTVPAQCQLLVSRAVERFGGVDVLVNNAGVGRFANVADMTLEAWRQVVDTNLSGVFHCCRAAIPEMKRRGAGFIINISSLAGKNPFTGGAAYCASKAGLNAFSEALMQEVRYDNIRVSYVMPGSVSTAFGDRGSSGEADWKLAPEDVARVVVDLLAHDPRSLPSRVELRPSRPKKG
jgi:NAD(P)-dependent dehydrogenase (short-subunit alcohol dehydrogenase family)